jgi:methyltransferase-like protein
MTKDDNYYIDYQFEDNIGNKFLVQFKNITLGKNILSKEYTMSYFVWDKDINNWSVTKLAKSSPYKIVATVLGNILNDFLSRKSYLCNKVQFEGLAKENEKEFQTQRTKMYLRYLENNPIPNFRMTNYGNNIITLTRINK